MKLIGIDPGPVMSGMVMWECNRVAKAEIIENRNLRDWLRLDAPPCHIKIEALACYGMPVGAEVFDTAYWIGRILQTWEDRNESIRLIFRREVKSFWCGSAKAKDSNIRQAIIDRFGGKDRAVGKKTAPGPLYGIHGHCWSALAIALCGEDVS